MNIIVVCQARMSSTRFPGKIFQNVCGKTLLELQIERMSQAKSPSQIIIATTINPNDDQIEDLCNKNNFEYFRGDEYDLLDRHYKAVKYLNPDAVVKIPSDCPLIDPKIIDKVIQFYIDNHHIYDYVSNLHPPTYPDGNDVEIMSFETLERNWKEAFRDFEREHTTPYIWDNPDKFRIGNVVWETGLDYSLSHRFTLDYIEDYMFIKAVYENLYYKNKFFSLEDILNLLNEKPEIYQLNNKYAGINWYRHHLRNLKTISPNMTSNFN